MQTQFFLLTLLPPSRYSVEMSHHVCDSGQSHDASVCHAIIMTSLSVCQSHYSSVCHTIKMTSPSICQSHDSSVCHATITTSPSICQSHNLSVCHTINVTSPSICQSHDSTVCQPNHDATWNSIYLSICPHALCRNSTSKYPSGLACMQADSNLEKITTSHFQVLNT